ncbi:MAG TPA: WD40 repeat domain-containing protein [Candidatus Acidoferrales bacterium]|jgi:WD40 repeat protein|nr:WD40 repeat domain-containing protein [Candidatus Acidoferrales bacterium]
MVPRRSCAVAVAVAVALVASLALPLLSSEKAQDCGSESVSINQILEMWPYHRPLMVRLLQEHGEAGITELVDVFRDHSRPTEFRRNALSILDEIRAPQTSELLLEAFTERDLQCLAISLSGRWRDPRFVPLLVGFLDDRRICGQLERISTSSSEIKKTDVFASDEAVQALEIITGTRFEGNKDLFEIGHQATGPWVDWWEKNRAQFEVSPQKFIVPVPPKRDDVSRGHYPCSVDKVAISPDGTKLFSGSKSYDGRMRLWDLKTKEQLWVQQANTDSITGAMFSPDGRLIATSSWDGSVMVWDASSGKRLWVFLIEDGADSVAFSPDGGLMAVGEDHGSIRLWNTRDWCLIRSLNSGDATQGIAFSPDGKMLATATFGQAQLWDVASGTKIRSLAVRPAGEPKMFADVGERDAQLWRMAWNVAFSPDGKHLATGSSAAVQVWDVSEGKETARIRSHGQVGGLTYSPDGQWIIWGNGNDEIRKWNPTTRKTRRIKNFASLGDIAITPDGRTVFSPGAGSVIEIYDLQTGKQAGEIKCHE